MKSFSEKTALAVGARHLDNARLLVEINPPGGGPALRIGSHAETYLGSRFEGILLAVSTARSRLDPFTLRMQPGGLAITVANNRPFMRWGRFSDLLADFPLVYGDITVYWVPGDAAAGFTLFRGKVEGALSATEERCTIEAVETAEALEDKLPLRRLNTADYPGADPGHVGRVIPRVYGRVERLACLSVDAGSISNLIADINDSATAIELTDASAFPSSGTVQLDAEKITYTGKSDNQLTGCGRGASGTTAVAHNKGAKVAEVQSSYIYLVADHPVKALDAVYVDDVRQTSGFTAYTGQTGDELAGYEGSAVIEFTVRPAVARQINVTHTDTDNISFNSSNTTRTVKPSGWQGNLVSDPANAYDGKSQSFATVNMPGGWFRLNFPDTDYGSITKQTLKIKLGALAGSWSIGGGWSPGSQAVLETGWFEFTKEGGSWDDYVDLEPPNAEGAYTVYECIKEVDYAPTLSKLGGGTGTLTGNTTAHTVIGRETTVDVQGYRDDASGTYTGTPNSLIERPDHIRRHMLIELFGLTAGEIDQDSFDAAGARFSSNSYTLAVVLDREYSFTGLAAALSLQTRSAIFWSQGRERIKWLEPGPLPDGGLSLESISEFEMRHGPRGRIRNALAALFDKRWDSPTDESYRGSVASSDPASQELYGKVAETFYLSWVTDASMAQSVLDFWLGFLKEERLVVRVETFWPALKYDPGDVVTFPDLPVLAGRTSAPGFLITRMGYAADRDTVEVEAVEV